MQAQAESARFIRKAVAEVANKNLLFTRFTSTKVQILTPEELPDCQEAAVKALFTRFTSTYVQILTPEELPGCQEAAVKAHHESRARLI
jgi:hypothetical protein